MASSESWKPRYQQTDDTAALQLRHLEPQDSSVEVRYLPVSAGMVEDWGIRRARTRKDARYRRDGVSGVSEAGTGHGDIGTEEGAL